MAVVQVVRVIVNPGHGLGSAHVGIFDEGASSPFGTEAYIVSRVADAVTDEYYLARDENCSPRNTISVIPTPQCSEQCALTHKYSHLSYVIDWINDTAIHDKAGYHDVLLSLHMNQSPKQETRGTLVVICGDAPPHRYEEARDIARIVANALGTPNLGVMLDTETPRKTIGIVRHTTPPAYLIELGFVSNPDDVKAVESCGKDAVKAVIEYFEKRK